MRAWISDLTKLLFPNNCFLCKQDLIPGEKQICTACLACLPQTNFHEHADNALSQKLKGRISFERAIAMYYFNAEGKMQEVLHEIKYRNNEHLAIYLGELLANKMKRVFADVDVIVPVPLHEARITERGYNQSELLAQGLSEQWSIPIMTQAVKRTKNTETQTHKTRSERVENMKNAFVWETQINNKHILIIDDVVTTGSTIESLVLALPTEGQNKISILSLAAAIES